MWKTKNLCPKGRINTENTKKRKKKKIISTAVKQQSNSNFQKGNNIFQFTKHVLSFLCRLQSQMFDGCTFEVPLLLANKGRRTSRKFTRSASYRRNVYSFGSYQARFVSLRSISSFSASYFNWTNWINYTYFLRFEPLWPSRAETNSCPVCQIDSSSFNPLLE